MEELLGHCEHEDADGRVVALDDASRSRILAAGTAMNEEARPPVLGPRWLLTCAATPELSHSLPA